MADEIGISIVPEISSQFGEKNKYTEYYNANCKFIQFKDFPRVRDEILAHLKDPKCPENIKIAFSDWFFRKMYMLYKPQGKVFDQVTETTKSSVRKCKHVILKSTYLRFTNIDATTNVAEHFYFDRYDDPNGANFLIQMLNDVQLVKNYVSNPKINQQEMKKHFLKWIMTVSVFEQRSNLLDILLRYYPRDPEVLQVREEMEYGDQKSLSKNFYTNNQNAHDDELNEETLKVAEIFIQDMKKVFDDEYKRTGKEIELGNIDLMLRGFFSKSPKYKEVVEPVLERCAIDHTTFGSGFDATKILVLIVIYIKKVAEHPKEMTEILIEEMEGTKGLCISGYIMRFMNVFRGFDERYEVNISFGKQLHAILTSVITKRSQECKDEDVILGTYDPDFKHKYLDFVKDIANEILPRLRQDYGKSDVDTNICAALKKMTECEWKLTKDTITYVTK